MKPISQHATIVASTEPGDVGRTGTIETHFVTGPKGEMTLVQRWVPNPVPNLNPNGAPLSNLKT